MNQDEKNTSDISIEEDPNLSSKNGEKVEKKNNTNDKQEAKNDSSENDQNTNDKEEIELNNSNSDITEWKEKFIRQAAEFENYKKRTIKEKSQIEYQSTFNVFLALLPIMDDLDRALTAAEKTDNLEQLKSGLKLIHKNLTHTLEKQGVKPIDSLGKEFNIEQHEAIAKVPAQNEEMKEKVIEIVQKGYHYKDAVLRYAKVIIGE